MNELLDWTSFAEELLDDHETEADGEEMSEGDQRRRATSLRSNKSARPSAKSLRRAQSTKGPLHANSSASSTSSADTEVPPIPTLGKKHSLASLRQMRSTASLAVKPPPIPARSPSRFTAALRQ